MPPRRSSPRSRSRSRRRFSRRRRTPASTSGCRSSGSLRRPGRLRARLRAAAGSRDDDRRYRHADRVAPWAAGRARAALVDLQELAERLRRDCPGTGRRPSARSSRTRRGGLRGRRRRRRGRRRQAGRRARGPALPDRLPRAPPRGARRRRPGGGRRGDPRQARPPAPARLRRRGAGHARRVKGRWEELKREQEEREGIFHDVPETLPALEARKVQRRAASAGFDWLDAAGPLAKVREEADELEAELGDAGSHAETEPSPRVFAEIGDLLFTVVNLARASTSTRSWRCGRPRRASSSASSARPRWPGRTGSTGARSA